MPSPTPFPSLLHTPPQFPFTSHPKTLKSSHSPPPLLAMKDRPPSSYGAVYVPPHHRLRSVITTPSYTSAALIDSKLREAQSAALNHKASPLPYLQTRQEQLHKGNSQNDDRLSEEGSDRELESLSQRVRLYFVFLKWISGFILIRWLSGFWILWLASSGFLSFSGFVIIVETIYLHKITIGTHIILTKTCGCCRSNWVVLIKKKLLGRTWIQKLRKDWPLWELDGLLDSYFV